MSKKEKRPAIASVLAEIDARLDADETLSASDRAQIKEKAREHVKKARKEKAEADYLKLAIKEVEREYNPHEQFEDFLVDLPNYTPYIRLDQVVYFHGLTYEVPYSVARTMADIQARSWEHESEINRAPRRGDQARKPRLLTIGPSQANVAASQITDLHSLTRI